MNVILRCCLLSTLLTFCAAPGLAQDDAAPPPEPRVTAATFAGLKLRELGPAITSGRVSDLAVDPSDPSHWYVAVASGGVWETHNRGTTWKPIFDSEGVYSVGCVTIDPHDPSVVWVGTGENNSQRSVGYGDGVYKSVDGGKSWQHVGLKASEHIGQIVVDPRSSDRVWVAAQGPLWSAGGDRGLYRTEDGGTTWELVLEIDEHTGVSELSLDPRDPDVLVAASYQRRRHVFTLINGGPGSAIHKSTDGGRTWRKVTRGLPGGDLGRIGLARAPSRPDTLYAIVEAQEDKGGFYRSVDGGESWQRQSSYVSRSPQYYQELYVDPTDPDRVYSMDVYMQVSEDAGKTWRNVGEDAKHVDNHALWIDPADPRHLVAGSDGGVYETFDRGASWAFKANLPITQFYRVTADDEFPFYNVYGGTQDNFSMGGPSRNTSANGITNRDWFMTLGGDGFETVVDPTDPDCVYSQYQHGGLVRYDRRSGETVDIKPQPGAGMEPLRWNWNAPLIISPHAPQRLYFAANYLFRSDDRGDSWHVVSGNLTRQLDRNVFPVMERVWSVDAVSKNRSTSIYGNVVALAESPRQEGWLYAGTDDGLLQRSTDAGATWTETETFAGVPEHTYVSALRASEHADATVYAAFDNHKRGDFAPYLLRSSDGGATWQSIAGDLPEKGTVYALAEDHEDPQLLFCGTEFGLFVTRDGGEQWLRLKGGLPTIAVRDLEIQRREDDLVVGTFGRGIWVLDDYGPLRQLDDDVVGERAVLLPVKRAWRFLERRPLGRGGKGFLGDAFFRAENPPVGAVLTYHVGEELETRKARRQAAEAAAREAGEPIPYPGFDALREEDREVKPEMVVTIHDPHGEVVRHISGPAGKGLHRVTWDLRWAAPSGRGPLVAPGVYFATLSAKVDGVLETLSGPQEVDVSDLPGARFPAADPAAAVAFQREAAQATASLQAASREASRMAERLDDLDTALARAPRAEADWWAAVAALRGAVADVRERLDGDRTVGRRYEATLPSLQQRARKAAGSAGSRSAPTQTQRDALALAQDGLADVLLDLAALETRVADLENKVEQAGGPAPAGRLPHKENP